MSVTFPVIVIFRLNLRMVEGCLLNTAATLINIADNSMKIFILNYVFQVFR